MCYCTQMSNKASVEKHIANHTLGSQSLIVWKSRHVRINDKKALGPIRRDPERPSELSMVTVSKSATVIVCATTLIASRACLRCVPTVQCT